MLDTPVYAGFRLCDGHLVKGTWTPIVSFDVWQQAQVRRQEQKRFNTPQRKRTPHLLTGLLVCGTCGANLNFRPSHKWKSGFYECRRSRDPGVCDGGSIGALGDRGNDWMTGGPGNDSLFGHDGRDILHGEGATTTCLEVASMTPAGVAPAATRARRSRKRSLRGRVVTTRANFARTLGVRSDGGNACSMLLVALLHLPPVAQGE